jgi:HD-GYP domain-containing protein (c-di-GMP phosphodiesterase class II)
MNDQLATQTLKYAEEFAELYAKERAERQRAEDALGAVEDALRSVEESYTSTVRALAVALELRDDDTGGHAERVTKLALQLTARVAPELAADPALEYGFLLHDVGKIGIPDAILLKPGPLTMEELALMRTHPRLGERIIAGVCHLDGVARAVVACHHECWNGHGYPEGLSGETIPLPARVFALADAFDAMTHDRPYRKALSIDVAVSELVSGSGTQFQPELVDSFLDLFQLELRHGRVA